MSPYIKTITVGILLTTVTSCSSAPTRQDVEEFESKAAGLIKPSSVLDFTSCVYDGFSQANSILSDVDTKQRSRTDGYRVETFAGGRILLMSADILNNGHVELWESSAALLINTSNERKAFKACLSTYGI